MGIEKFEFERSRGIVWVCDLSESSRFLNNNNSAEALEEFLPRLYWASAIAVDAAGGRFIKWTGDGFLAWFETPLHREVASSLDELFRAAYFLTVLVNITQLGVESKDRFRIHHGVCFEHDALLIKITHPDHQSLDLIGRAVVLAFRLSGLPADFPNIVTQKELVVQASPPRSYSWKKRTLKKEERLKFFKGEVWGTRSIYASSSQIRKPRSITATVNSMQKALTVFDGHQGIAEDSFGAKLVPKLLNGPDWCRDVMKQYGDHTKDLYLAVANALPIMKDFAKRTPK